MKGIAVLVFLCMPWMALGQQEIALYESETPNSRVSNITEKAEAGDDGILRVSQVTKPILSVYQPPVGIKHTGKAVIICPGGGYGILAMSHEGYDVAIELANAGITAFVLKYRLPNDVSMMDKSIGPLQDAQRAIQIVRERAVEWGVEIDQIGVAGFSAGGHLASTLSTHYQQALIANPKGTSLRPDFSLLVYPVISFDERITHAGSRTNLLGSDPPKEQVQFFSNDQCTTVDTPPAFLVHAEDDTAVPIAHSKLYLAALQAHGIESLLITYPYGGHGFGLNNKTTTDKWVEHFVKWVNSL